MVPFDKFCFFLVFLIFGTVGIIWMNLSNLTWTQPFKTNVEISNEQIKFNAYLKYYGKKYYGDEYQKRFGYFKKSLEEISVQNGPNGTGAKHGLTKFSDLSQAEFAELIHNPTYSECEEYCETRPQTGSKNSFQNKISQRPKIAWDWRERGAVGPVLNQKMCNGCWAFSIVGVMESMEVIKYNRTYTQRSIQELIDCSTFNKGCSFGHVSSALYFLCRNSLGIIREDEYPLKLLQGPCNKDLIDEYSKDSLCVKFYETKCDVTDEEIMRLVSNHGPVMAVVNAAPWQHYTGGIIHRACYRSRDGNTMDHVVQIVGYNRNSNPPYYIVRNSWGEDFGDHGYVKVAMGGKVCGISEEITYLDVL